MLFNSFQFLFFFPLVTSLYFLVPFKYRWAFLLAASCIFYMAFVPAYIFILLATIVIDYFAALWIEKIGDKSKKPFLILSIISTCTALFIFKYFNFFNFNLQAFARIVGWNYSAGALRFILPIGLSFHTFQGLCYVIEVYRGHQRPEHHFGRYALYVMFYPTLVAGPIERPYNLLRQLSVEHSFDYQRVLDGLKLMLWGMFKKMVIADRLAVFVNEVYGYPFEYQGASLILATVFFAFQIYCDFSGYSDIAIGAAQVMGFRLLDNFNRPYSSKSTAEFWHRWHISLSSWFRDYLYIPLGGSRVSISRWCVIIGIVFLVSGLWHGANWTFVIWGALHGFYVMFGRLTKGIREKIVDILGLKAFPGLYVALQVTITFSLVCFAWIFFRAANVHEALYIATHLFAPLSLRADAWQPLLIGQGKLDFLIALCLIIFMGFVHWLQRHDTIRCMFREKPAALRWALYYCLSLGIIFLGIFRHNNFIYFQF